MIAYFLFYDYSTGKQAKLAFSKEFRHCNIITYDGEAWVNVEFDSTGLLTKVLDVPSGNALIRGLKSIKMLTAMIVVDIGERKKVLWKPLWGRSCNELDRYVSGVDIGLTFNPIHLYRKLLRYDGKRNYEILYAWRRHDGTIRRRRRPEPTHERPDGTTDQGESSGVRGEKTKPLSGKA